jgi:hypothetical protein
MQRPVVAALAVAIALFVAFARSPESTAGAAMATPTPAALQYEEIGRIVLGGTPPPPGSFQDDRAAVVAAANTPAPAHGLFGGIQNTMNQAMSQVHALQTGTLTRYTYFNNWVRTDDVVDNTAVIVKCDLHQYISLDLAHRTYRVTSTVPQTQPMPAAGPYAPQPATSAEPGTADMTLTGSRQNLVSQTLDGVPTQGQSAEFTMSTTNATGSCKNSSFSINLTEYVSNIRIPRPHCPLPEARVPQSPRAWVSHPGGCTPRIHGSASGMEGLMDTGDRLAMYRVMSMSGAEASGRTFKTVTEAGNVRWLGASDAQGLFAIPDGFTQQQ